jgi:hypothetical protein
MAGVVARIGLAVATQYIGDLEDGPIRTKASGSWPASGHRLTQAASLPAISPAVRRAVDIKSDRMIAPKCDRCNNEVHLHRDRPDIRPEAEYV